MASCGGFESRLRAGKQTRRTSAKGGHCCDRSQAKEHGLEPAVSIRAGSLLEASDT